MARLLLGIRPCKFPQLGQLTIGLAPFDACMQVALHQSGAPPVSASVKRVQPGFASNTAGTTST